MRTIQQILMDYINKGFQPFEPLQGAMVKLERFEMQAGEKVELVFESEKGVEYPYTKRIKDVENWLFENFIVPEDELPEPTAIEEFDVAEENEVEAEDEDSIFHELYPQLFGAIKDIRNGKIDSSKGMAIAAISSQIISAAKVEIDYARYDFQLPKLAL